ncbi:MAG: radical SAM protein [Candidatus Aenigmarchaeota archaeon]|nr:radical SAM protein [Candidatus Aenigmarchaeota archaeon]
MQVINLFDPWKSKFCTCPTKYSFSPYTGCSHGCLYCYASSYIPNFFTCKPKKDLLKRLASDLKKIDKRIYVSIANSSDPYPPLEHKLRLTRDCLKLLVANNCKFLLITKSNLVERDKDVLSKAKVCVSFSLTTLDEDAAKKLEPNAPLPQKRLAAMENLIKHNIQVAMRIDPIIPGINDSEIGDLLKSVAEIGVKHIVSSTYKARFDSWNRMYKVFPEVMEKLKDLYFRQGEKISNSYYLPTSIRFKLMKKVKESCDKFGLTFACCREGFIELNTPKSCDGSHLITINL